jgi:RNA recognition motif. (a.k.a. RRM, RBD, or RNP domain)
MARNNYSAGKQQRERDKERKKQEKAQRRQELESRGGSGGNIPTATVEEIQGGGYIMSIDEVMRSMQGGGEGEAEPVARTIPSRLFVGGLDWRITEAELRAQLEQVGPVADAIVVMDRDTGESRGFGFVTMADRKDAAEAIRRLNGSQLEGRTLVVRQAEERRGGGGGGGGRR